MIQNNHFFLLLDNVIETQFTIEPFICQVSRAWSIPLVYIGNSIHRTPVAIMACTDHAACKGIPCQSVCKHALLTIWYRIPIHLCADFEPATRGADGVIEVHGPSFC